MVEEVFFFSVNFSFDNYFFISLGSEWIGFSLDYKNFIGFGDCLLGSYYVFIIGGLDIFDFNYQVFFNFIDGIFNLCFVFIWIRIIQFFFDVFDIIGSNFFYEISYC